jgi:hypothetical protein
MSVHRYKLSNELGQTDLVLRGYLGRDAIAAMSAGLSWPALQAEFEHVDAHIEKLVVDGTDLVPSAMSVALDSPFHDLEVVFRWRIDEPRSQNNFLFVTQLCAEFHLSERQLYQGSVELDVREIIRSIEWTSAVLASIGAERLSIGRDGAALQDFPLHLGLQGQALDVLVSTIAEMHSTCDSDLDDVAESYRQELAHSSHPA